MTGGNHHGLSFNFDVEMTLTLINPGPFHSGRIHAIRCGGLMWSKLDAYNWVVLWHGLKSRTDTKKTSTVHFGTLEWQEHMSINAIAVPELQYGHQQLLTVACWANGARMAWNINWHAWCNMPKCHRPKLVCYNKIRLCAQNVDHILGSINNITIAST